MGKNISIIEQNDGRQLVYETDNKNKNDIVINFAKNNDIPHLAEMKIEEGDGLKGIYTITDCIPVMKSVSNFPGRDEVFTLIRKIIYVLEELKESFIRESDLLLNKDYIFIDQKSDVIKFILTPDIQEEKVTIKEFIEDILVTTSWKRIEYKSYLNVLGAAISRSDVTYIDIIDVINEELENPVQYHTIETPLGEDTQDANSNDTSKEVETIEEIIEETNTVVQVEENVQQQSEEVQNLEILEQSKEAQSSEVLNELKQTQTTEEPVQPQMAEIAKETIQPQVSAEPVSIQTQAPITPSEPQPSVQSTQSQAPIAPAEPQPPVQSIQPQAPITPAEPQPPVQSIQPQTPITPAEPQPPVQSIQPQAPITPVQPQGFVQPTPQPAAPTQPMVSAVPPIQMPQTDNDSQFGETTVLSDQFGETTVLGASTVPMICPILTRIKTGEKVVINKTEFYIGKDPTKVDYCIFNNSAISRVHIRIVCKNGEFFVVDNNSTNHVYVNGRRIEPDVEVRLEHDCRVRLGDEDFQFRFQ